MLNRPLSASLLGSMISWTKMCVAMDYMRRGQTCKKISLIQ